MTLAQRIMISLLQFSSFQSKKWDIEAALEVKVIM